MSHKYNLSPNPKACSQSTFRRTHQSRRVKAFAQVVSTKKNKEMIFTTVRAPPGARAYELETGLQGLREEYFLCYTYSAVSLAHLFN